DPHGDPIPKADLSLTKATTVPLADCPVGCHFRLARVLDQSPEFLRYLSESHLELGSNARVLANRAEAGVLTLRVGSHEARLGSEAARGILVEVLEDAG